MHPTGVATAAWVFASAHSKTPFYLAGGLLAGWAVVLGAFGVMHPDFPGSTAASRLVMLISAVLVAGAVTTAVTTAGEESATEGGPRGHRLGGADERAEPERRSDGKAGLRQEAGDGPCGPVRGPAGQQLLAATQRHDRQGGKGPRPDQDGLRRFGDHHRGPGAGRVRLLLLGRRAPGRGDAGHAHRQMSGLLRPRAYERARRAPLVPARGDKAGVGPSGRRSLSGDLPQPNRRCTTATTRTMGLIARAWLWSRIRAPVRPGGSRARRTCDAG